MTTSSRLKLASLLAFVCAVALVATSRSLHAQAGDRERTIYVSALDDKGEPVAGLGPDAFVVKEDDRRREVLRVSKAVEPMDIALLIDNSQAAEPAISFMRTALPAFVAKVAPGNQVAVITLAERPTIVTDYTSDPKRLADATARLFSMPGSGMTLLDALIETSRGITKRESPRAVIVTVTTDGTEFTNRYSKDVVRTLTEARVALHFVGIGTFPHSEEHDLRERSFFIDEAPRATGGERITVLVANGLDTALGRLGRVLTSQYKVVYGRPESLIPPEKIEVSSARDAVTMHATPSREKKDR